MGKINLHEQSLRIPNFLTIIMDGNNRWLQVRGLPRKTGLQAGVQASREIIAAHQHGEFNASELTMDDFARHLQCSDIPDTNLIIHTGGEWRLSNFLIWRAVNAVF